MDEWQMSKKCCASLVERDISAFHHGAPSGPILGKLRVATPLTEKHGATIIYQKTSVLNRGTVVFLTIFDVMSLHTAKLTAKWQPVIEIHPWWTWHGLGIQSKFYQLACGCSSPKNAQDHLILNGFGPVAPVGFIVMRLGYLCGKSGSKMHHESGRSPVELLLTDKRICRGWFLRRVRLEQNSSGSRPIGSSSLFFLGMQKTLTYSQMEVLDFFRDWFSQTSCTCKILKAKSRTCFAISQLERFKS